MEADWEMEIGGDAAVIDAAWAGFVDLHLTPERALELEEVRAFPALGEALQRLNADGSPVWTAKCDFWPELEAGSFDPYEMDAEPSDAEDCAGCYVDLLPNPPQAWATIAAVEQACRDFCMHIKARALAQCRIDLIVRSAWTSPEQTTHGITAYLTACAATRTAATAQLATCLSLFTEAVLAQPASIPQSGNSTVQ